MKFHTEYLKFHTKTKRAYVHITPQVEGILRKSGIKEGMILVSAMHITADAYDYYLNNVMCRFKVCYLLTPCPSDPSFLPSVRSSFSHSC